MIRISVSIDKLYEWSITHKQFELILRLKVETFFDSSVLKSEYFLFLCSSVTVNWDIWRRRFRRFFLSFNQILFWSINRERPTTLVFIRCQFSALVWGLRRLQACFPFSGPIIKISLAVWSLQMADGPPASVQVPYGAFLKRRRSLERRSQSGDTVPGVGRRAGISASFQNRRGQMEAKSQQKREGGQQAPAHDPYSTLLNVN